MSNSEVLEIFASKFVRADFRARFVHEARKRPEKLYARICHNLGDLFDKSYANVRCKFGGTETCLVLSGSKGFWATTGAEANRLMGLGDGLLVIGSGGAKFCAETEAMQGAPSVSYAAGS